MRPPANAPVASMSRPCSHAAMSSPHACTSKSRATSAVPRRKVPPSIRRSKSSSSSLSTSTSSTSTSASSSWVDYIPRIVENIPRRVPPGTQDALQRAAGADGTGVSGGGSTVIDVGGAVDALRRLVFPESLAAPSDLTLPVVIFGALGVGLVLELATLVLKAVEGGSGGGGGRGSGGAAPPPPVDAPIVPPPPPPTSPSALRAAKAPTTPSRAQIEAERERLRDRIVAERYRGLTWLAAATAAALFTAGLMSGPSALRP